MLYQAIVVYEIMKPNDESIRYLVLLALNDDELVQTKHQSELLATLQSLLSAQEVQELDKCDDKSI